MTVDEEGEGPGSPESILTGLVERVFWGGPAKVQKVLVVRARGQGTRLYGERHVGLSAAFREAALPKTILTHPPQRQGRRAVRTITFEIRALHLAPLMAMLKNTGGLSCWEGRAAVLPRSSRDVLPCCLAA